MLLMVALLGLVGCAVVSAGFFTPPAAAAGDDVAWAHGQWFRLYALHSVQHTMLAVL